MIAIAEPPKRPKPETVRKTLRPQEGPQEKFLASDADIVIYGGAAGGGKSFALLLEPTRHIDNPGFAAVIFRSTTPEITNPGGLWDESSAIYAGNAEPRVGLLEWRFPSGARVKFAHLEHEQDKYNWQGAQIAYIGFDELTHFSAGQFWYLLSRNRSKCGVKPYVRATCNPDADSWVAELVSWWIDEETGYPIPERSGVVRWFLHYADRLHWADSYEECREIGRDLHLADEDNLPKSFTFIAASLDDNPALTEADPGYRANLLSQPNVDQERLLRGNWKIRVSDGSMWSPDCFDEIWGETWPDAFEASVIAIDPAQGKTGSDYSAIVFVGLCGGRFWVDASIARIGSGEIASRLAEMARELRPDLVVMESNANQEEAYGPPCQQAAIEAGVGPLPMGFEFQSVKKEYRIRRLNPHILSGHFRFRPGSPGCKVLESQLRAFPLKFPDDGPDALEHAVYQLKKLIGGYYEEPDTVEEFAL